MGQERVRQMKLVFVLLLLLMLAPLSFAAICYGVGESDARAAVSEAQQRINTCYAAAADAAKAGANVTGLLSILNDAGTSLSRAELALGQGDFNSAYSLAHEGEGKLIGFEVVASGLRDSAVKCG